MYAAIVNFQITHEILFKYATKQYSNALILFRLSFIRAECNLRPKTVYLEEATFLNNALFPPYILLVRTIAQKTVGNPLRDKQMYAKYLQNMKRTLVW